MTHLLRRILASLATLLVAAHAHTYEAGWMQIMDSPSMSIPLELLQPAALGQRRATAQNLCRREGKRRALI